MATTDAISISTMMASSRNKNGCPFIADQRSTPILDRAAPGTLHRDGARLRSGDLHSLPVREDHLGVLQAAHNLQPLIEDRDGPGEGVRAFQPDAIRRQDMH